MRMDGWMVRMIDERVGYRNRKEEKRREKEKKRKGVTRKARR